MKKQILLALAALALSGAASAQTYGVVAVGSSKVDADCGGFSCDTSDTAFKLLLGYKFHPNFALEGGYMNFGEAKVPDLGAKFKADAFVIGGAFHHDLSSDWNFVARLGLAQVKAKVSVSGFGSDSDSSAKPYGGLGVGYKLNKQMSIDAAWDFTKAEYEGDKADIRVLSLGLTYAF